MPALLVEVDASVVGAVKEYPLARGFEFYPQSVTPGPRGRTRLCLVLADTRYRDVFEVLVNDVSERMAAAPGEGEAVKAFIARLHIWQNFMRKHGIGGLTKEAQIGLFGELLFLAAHLLEQTPAHDAVNAWKGPAGGNQDFNIGGRCVEVKCTTVIPPVSVGITSMVQLDDTLVELLLLCHISLVLGGGDGESPPGTDRSPQGRHPNPGRVGTGWFQCKADRGGLPRCPFRVVFGCEIPTPGDKILHGNERISPSYNGGSSRGNLGMQLHGSSCRLRAL